MSMARMVYSFGFQATTIHALLSCLAMGCARRRASNSIALLTGSGPAAISKGPEKMHNGWVVWLQCQNDSATAEDFLPYGVWMYLSLGMWTIPSLKNASMDPSATSVDMAHPHRDSTLRKRRPPGFRDAQRLFMTSVLVFDIIEDFAGNGCIKKIQRARRDILLCSSAHR